jgi:CheY-like chemotaxis protein
MSGDPTSHPHRHRVLLVEDDADCREAITAMLEAAGHTVVGAENGKVALDRMRDSGPCVIVLDLMMPVMDGRRFRAAQLRDEAHASLPVVIMSGAAQVDEQAQQLGVQDYIAKPVDPDQLLAMLGRYCAS